MITLIMMMRFLQQLIAPGSGLRRLEYRNRRFKNTIELHTSKPISLLFQPSSLQELTLDLGLQDIVLHDELLPHENTNLKELTISRNLLHPLAALIMNITSLTYLEIFFF